MLGQKLLERRTAKGMTQQELAVAAGLHAITVSRIERGAVQPDLSTVEALARALGATVAELLGDPEVDPEVEPVEAVGQ